MVTDLGPVGVTQTIDTRAFEEGMVNPRGRRGGVGMFYMNPARGYPTLQAIDDTTYVHLTRDKGRIPLPEYGYHPTIPMQVQVGNGVRRVRPLVDVEILDRFSKGQTVAGVTPTIEQQLQCRVWLAAMFAPSPLDGILLPCRGCNKTFMSRLAFDAHLLTCAPPPEAAPDPDAIVAKPPRLYFCKVAGCNEGFEQAVLLANHTRRTHPKPKSGKRTYAT